MKLLAIETATEACSAALFLDGKLSERFEVRPRGHSEMILGMMEELLATAQLTPARLDALAFGRGPGSFTGVRIATGVVQGVAFAADLPVVPVSTLAALAQGAFRRTGARRLLPAYDARMGEIYWAQYEIDRGDCARLVGQEQIAPAADVDVPEDGNWHGVGSGWAAYGDLLAQRLGARVADTDPGLLCSAQDVAVLGATGFLEGLGVPAEQALPVYLRDRVARRPGG